jgi:hypothetical protein
VALRCHRWPPHSSTVRETLQLRRLFGRCVQGFGTNDRVICGLSNPRLEHLRQAERALLGHVADDQIAASVVGPRGERQIAAAL